MIELRGQIAQAGWSVVDAMPGIVRRIGSAWNRAGIHHTILGEKGSGQHIEVSFPRDQREQGLRIACAELRSADWNTCVERTAWTWFLLAFKAENGKFTALRIDLVAPARRRAIRFLTSLRDLIFRGRAPCIALVGPDGVGKSTVLSFVRQWFEQEAPFLSVYIRQWRPALLPALGRFIGKPEITTETAAKPRRRPGKVHLVRLGYYYFDFVLGSWWKDRRDSSQPKLIIYDRCALDMTVDPYRFALTSSWGAGLLWRMTPKPSMIILLCDEPQRIYRRKQEIEPHEMQEQLTAWFRLAKEDEIHAIIRVDDPPEEIAARVLNLVIDGFVRGNEHDSSDVVEGNGRLEWIGSILTGRTEND